MAIKVRNILRLNNIGPRSWFRGLGLMLMLVTPLPGYSVDIEQVLAQAQIHFNEARYQKATQAYQRILLDKPNNSEARFGLAKSLNARGYHNSAKAEIEKLLQTTPNHIDALTLLAEIFAQQGDWKAAKRAYKEALSVDSNHGRARLGLGQAHMQLGEKEKAETAFGQAREDLDLGQTKGQKKKESGRP